MDQYTPQQTVQIMKVFYCMGFEEFFQMYGRDIDDDPGEYLADKFGYMKKDIFKWLCELDKETINMVFDYAAKKVVIYKLKGAA